ncbi:DUF99 domain-containing protein [Candidatus Geothermarchaeota archaeon]|nr:MAG: DUF99 domain-containing protein [Candidatus Geothermarchaeota archaeon]
MKLRIRIKPGSRMLGVAESFQKGISKKSVLAGVVMRSDLIIDGFGFSFPTIGGMDATERVMELYSELKREDLNFLCINGCVISWFNVIDLNRLYEELKLPIISITYEESPGLEKYFREYFPDDYKRRIEVYRRNGRRVKVRIRTGHEVFIRNLGIDVDKAVDVLNSFTIYGKLPEPIRVARILAHELSKKLIKAGILR